MIRLCIFDLDGTTANTIDDLSDAMNYALNCNGFRTHTAQEYKKLVGDGIDVLIKRACASDDLDIHNEIKTGFYSYYSEHCTDKTDIYKDVDALLNKLSQNGVKFGIISNKPHEFVPVIINKLYPGYDFLFVYGKTDEFPRKPDPALVLSVIKQYGIDKDECVYIGDSNVDVKTAENAGVACIGVTWGFRGREELENAGADYIAEKPLDIFDIISSIS